MERRPGQDVLEDAGIKDDAVYIGYYGADTHLSGQPGKLAISRGVPINKTLEDESLVAWGMNGRPLQRMNGWEDIIHLMQSEHGLWNPGADEAAIIDYLGRHYGPDKSVRRIRKGTLPQQQ